MSTTLTALSIGHGTLAKGAATELVLRNYGKIVVSNRTQEKSEKSAEALRLEVQRLGKSTVVIPLALDVAPDPDEKPEIPPVTVDRFLANLEAANVGEIDVVLLASGGNRGDANFGLELKEPEPFPAEEVDMATRESIAAEWDNWNAKAMPKVYSSNSLGPVELLYKLGKRLTLQTAAPTIILVASVSPHISGVNHYAAAKDAMEREVKRYRIYLSNLRRRAGLVAPSVCLIVWGFTESPQSRAFLYKDGIPTHRCVKILAATPLNRMGTVEEFGKTVMAAVDVPYISIIEADGGFSESFIV